MSETRVVHCKREPYDVYIARPSKWGNPFTFRPSKLAQFQVKDREQAIAAYEEWIMDQPELLAEVHTLAGKTLACWCAPKPCHGHVLARLADEAAKQRGGT